MNVTAMPMRTMQVRTNTAPASLAQPANENGDLRPIIGSNGRAAHWPARNMIVLRHFGASKNPVTLKVPLNWYQGIAAEVVISPDGRVEKVQVLLAHRDAGLEVVLHEADNDLSLIAEWNYWSRTFALPMLVRTEMGDSPTSNRFGGLDIHPPAPRRALRAFLQRRTRFARRRKTGKTA